MCGSAVLSSVDAGMNVREHCARLRPLHGDHRPLLRRGRQPDLQLGELGLQVILHHVQHACGAAGGRRDVKAIGCEAADDAVVDDEAGLVQQNAVAAAADTEAYGRR